MLGDARVLVAGDPLTGGAVPDTTAWILLARRWRR
jgi:hypothetical protein